MTKQRKPNAVDWRNRPTEDWTLTTFRQYLTDQHNERYGITYTAWKSYAIEGRWLKSMLAEHGPEVVLDFIDACFREYKPTKEWPGCNFGFMFIYQRSRVLPRVLADRKRKAVVQQAVEETEDLSDWL